MVNSKANKSKAQKTPTPLPSSASVVAASAAPAKKATKKPVATKTAAKRVPKVKDAAPAAVDPPASVVVECDTEQHAASDVRSPTIVVSEDFTAYLAKLQHAVSILSTLRTEFRNLERRTLREIRASEKLNNKRKRKAGTRAPSGFVKPTLISDELATFLAKPKGSEMARTEVTREINAYIRANHLQDKENGRKINADAKLTSLLSLTAADELTYFNLQKYMSRHFAKASDTAAAAAALASASQ
jgi:chromatin remodeling complex protein RSC6